MTRARTAGVLSVLALCGACGGAPREPRAPVAGDPSVARETVSARTAEPRADQPSGGATGGTRVARIIGVGARVVRDPARIGGTHTADLVEDARWYRIVEQSSVPNDRHEPPERLVVEDPANCGGGYPACLVFVGHEWPRIAGARRDANDRLEIDLSHAEDEDALQLGEWRYLRFALRVEPETAPVARDADTLIAQVWQSHRVAPGIALGPPLRISIENASDGTSVRLSFRALDDRARISTEIHGEVIGRGEWHMIHLAMRPEAFAPERDPGTIRVWMDQGLEFDFDPSVPPRNGTDRVHWGFAPRGLASDGACAEPAGPCVTPRFSVRLGMYRSQSEGDPGLTATRFSIAAAKLTRAPGEMPGL